MRRFSIRALMAFVVASAVGLAALRSANGLWAAILLTLALVAVGAAVLGALILREGPRYGWAGFAVFSGGYLILAVGPGLSDAFKPHLGTTYLLNYVKSRVEAALAPELLERQTQRAQLAQLITKFRPSTPEVAALTDQLATVDAAIEQERVLQSYGERWRSLLPGAVNQNEFLCVGHSLFALLAGLLGRMLAAWFYVRRERAEVAAARSED
jgi:hypothetical protein